MLPEPPNQIDPETPAQRAKRMRELAEKYGRHSIPPEALVAADLSSVAGRGRPRRRERRQKGEL